MNQLAIQDLPVLPTASFYNCGQKSVDPSLEINFGSSKKQVNPVWKSPETANIQQKQQMV